MAKKITEVTKTTEELDNQAEVKETLNSEAPTSSETLAENKPQEIDESILKVLKTFPEYKELYVDAKGGAFTPATPKSALGNAVLYQNPYFKN